MDETYVRSFTEEVVDGVRVEVVCDDDPELKGSLSDSHSKRPLYIHSPDARRLRAQKS